MWWISGLLAYRSADGGEVGGAAASVSILRLKTCLSKGVEDPNDPKTMEALRGLLLVDSWYGRSFCVCSHILVFDALVAQLQSTHTNSTLALPFPFTVNGNVSSNPVPSSAKVKNA